MQLRKFSLPIKKEKMEETNLENQVQMNEEQSRVNVSEQVPPMPSNNMVLAILTTVCCCLPLGIVAVIKASQVSSLYMAKQYAAAQKSADDAKKWALIGMGCGIFFDIIYAILWFTGTLLSLS